MLKNSNSFCIMCGAAHDRLGMALQVVLAEADLNIGLVSLNRPAFRHGSTTDGTGNDRSTNVLSRRDRTGFRRGNSSREAPRDDRLGMGLQVVRLDESRHRFQPFLREVRDTSMKSP